MKLNYALKFAGRSTHKIKRFLKRKQSNNKARATKQQSKTERTVRDQGADRLTDEKYIKREIATKVSNGYPEIF